jgi:type II secretory ATPase GspE/PulE/Tfp pilus assembly ATPase PilB-like protein
MKILSDMDIAEIVIGEDPVEYTLPGVNQVQAKVKAGLTFAGFSRRHGSLT